MEKKITFVVLSIVFIISCKNYNSNNNGKYTDNFDTIFFASDISAHRNIKAFLVKGANKEENIVLLKTISKGKSVWVDSLLFEKNGQKSFFCIIREPTQGYFALYYNGINLVEEKISYNLPNIYVDEFSDSLVVITKDSVYNSGNIFYLYFKYILSDSCILIRKKTTHNTVKLHQMVCNKD